MAQKNYGHLIEKHFSNSLMSRGISYGRRCTRLHLWWEASRKSYRQRLYSFEAYVLKADAGGDEENDTEEKLHDKAQPEKNKSRLSRRGARFKEEFLSRIVPWEKIPVSFDTFPYYIDNDTKCLLMECMASHLKHNKFRNYACVLKHSSNRIQLQSIPGTDLYRERLVSAVARELRVPLLKLDSSTLPPYDINQHCKTQMESDDEDSESDQESDSSDEGKDDDEEENKQTSAKPDNVCFKKGDRVKYVGKSTSIEEAKNRTLSSNHRGEVHDVNGDKVAVIFNDCGLEIIEEEKNGKKSTETTAQETLTWLKVEDVQREDDAQSHDCFISMEVLYEVLQSQQPIIVYFPDSFFPNLGEDSRSDFVNKAKKMFQQLKGRVVLICGQNKREAGSRLMKKFPFNVKTYSQRLKEAKISQHRINELFTNIICINPPKDEDSDTFIKQIKEDKATVISEGNLSLIHQVLKAHRLLCTNLEQANITDTILTREEVEKIVAWATNHYLSSSTLPCVKDDVLHIPHDSLKLAILRLQRQKNKTTKSAKEVAEDCFEKELIPAVVSAGDIGVKFEDVGALENVKTTLYETVILPLKRPELFSHGNLLRPCKGILLFGPPGTGKTMMAKALATEAGANFINITTATLTSAWVGETERLTKALFSYARKLAPAIIFVDEVDSLFAARGHNNHDTSRLNEFMASWDGLMSKDSQRILVVGATNRPFDLDDAVLRRMPRRVYVGLPDAKSRSKILKVLLLKENLEPGFSVEQLAEATEGYSGDDLKNLCIAAACRPVKELLERESNGEKSDGAPALRPLQIDDFIVSKAKVRPSVRSDGSSIKKLREWDEKYGDGGSKCIPFGF